jgi:glycosyltransferase involved in cell wall biosynthesis
MVSIVVSCYNYAHYLETCVNSILSQTYTDFEVIIVNDGSTDNTSEVVERWTTEPRIRYIEQANAGQATAKNVGVNHARGDYVAFLDADDYWQPDKLERQMPLFDDPRVGVVYSRACYVDEDGQDTGFTPTSVYLRPRRGEVTDYLIFDNFVLFSSSIVRADCFKRHGLFDESIAMAIDWDLWLRFSKDCRFDFVDDTLLYYRVGHANQMSRNRELRQQCCDRIMAAFTEHNPGLVSGRTLRLAAAYAAASRGRYFENHDRPRALRYHLRSLTHQPFQFPAYKGLIRLLIGRRPTG